MVDGLLGMQAKLPLRAPIKEWVALLNEETKLGVRLGGFAHRFDRGQWNGNPAG